MTGGDKVVEVARDQVVEAAIAWTHAYEDGTTEDLRQAMLELRRSVRLLLELDARVAEPQWQGVGESMRGLWVRQKTSCGHPAYASGSDGVCVHCPPPRKENKLGGS